MSIITLLSNIFGLSAQFFDNTISTNQLIDGISQKLSDFADIRDPMYSEVIDLTQNLITSNCCLECHGEYGIKEGSEEYQKLLKMHTEKDFVNYLTNVLAVLNKLDVDETAIGKEVLPDFFIEEYDSTLKSLKIDPARFDHYEKSLHDWHHALPKKVFEKLMLRAKIVYTASKIKFNFKSY